MMDAMVRAIADAINNVFGAQLAVFLLSIIPIAEARFAIPFGMSMGLSPAIALLWAFLGSSLMAPILVLVFIPILNALSKTKLFSKVGGYLYEKIKHKSQSVNAGNAPEDGAKKPILSRHELKKMGGVALFVAVPLPLTGVWTGSAVASIINLGFVKAVISVIIGNAVACGIITLISVLFASYVDYITFAFFVIAVGVLVALIIKMILYKPKNTADHASQPVEHDQTTQNKE